MASRIVHIKRCRNEHSKNDVYKAAHDHASIRKEGNIPKRLNGGDMPNSGRPALY